MARLTKHHSLIRAEKVLSAINSLGVSPVVAQRFSDVGVWQNGREQGLRIHGACIPAKGCARWVGVWFAEARSSDETVVVFEVSAPGKVLGEGPSDQAWETRREYFPPDAIESAASHIVNFLEKVVFLYHVEEQE